MHAYQTTSQSHPHLEKSQNSSILSLHHVSCALSQSEILGAFAAHLRTSDLQSCVRTQCGLTTEWSACVSAAFWAGELSLPAKATHVVAAPAKRTLAMRMDSFMIVAPELDEKRQSRNRLDYCSLGFAGRPHGDVLITFSSGIGSAQGFFKRSRTDGALTSRMHRATCQNSAPCVPLCSSTIYNFSDLAHAYGVSSP